MIVHGKRCYRHLVCNSAGQGTFIYERVTLVGIMWRLPLLLVFLALAVQCQAADTLESRLLLLAGENPVDCGTVEVRQDPIPASNCAKQAFVSKKAFVVRYLLGVSYDSDVITAFAGTKLGKVFAIEYGSMGWGPAKKPARLLDGKHNLVTTCPTPGTTEEHKVWQAYLLQL